MGLTQTLIIVGLLLFGYAYLMPDDFEQRKAELFSKIGLSDDTLETVKTGTDQVESLVNDLSSNETNQAEELVENLPLQEEALEEEPVYEMIDVCSRPYSDAPDYYGTTKWGQMCNDVVIDPDFECLKYPPTRYTGNINLLEKTSSPQMNCCLNDGKCYWG